MFKKYYKQANDDIKTNRELIDKIFEAAEKPSKTVKFAKVYKYGTAAAAVFVFAAGAFLYPQIAKLNKTPKPVVESGQVIEEKKPEPVIYDTKEQKSQNEAFAPIIQEKNSARTASEPAPEITADVENSGIAAEAETEDTQPFSVPKRMLDAPPVADMAEIMTDSFKGIAAEETERVQQFLRTTFGEKDEETGNVFLFEISGKVENMYLGRWKWQLDDHSSLLCEFVLNDELTEMYECTYTEEGMVQWNTQNNMLSN